MIRSFDLLRRMRAAVTSVLLLSATGSYAPEHGDHRGSVASPDCLEYRVVGICYWLYCTWTGCTVRTSVKVRHCIPMRWFRPTRTPARTLGRSARHEHAQPFRPRPAGTAPPMKITKTISRSSRTRTSSATPASRCSTSSSRPRAISARAQARPSCRTCSVRWTRRPGATTYRRCVYPEALILACARSARARP